MSRGFRLTEKGDMPPPTSSIGVLGFIAFVVSGALLSFSLHKIEEGLLIVVIPHYFC